jgi:hypothetical protein
MKRVDIIVLILLSAVGVRKGYLPHPKEWLERFQEAAQTARSVTRIGVPYRAPPVPTYELPGLRSSSYKAPQAAASVKQVAETEEG